MEDIEVNFIKTFEGPIKLPYSMHKLASWLWPYFHRTKRKKLWHNIEAQKKYKQNLLQQQRQQRQQQQKQQKQQQQNEKSNLSISKDTNIDNVSTTIQEKKKVKFNSNVPSISTISNHINPDYEPPHHAGIKFIDMPQPKQMRPKRQNMSVTPTSNKNSALRPQMIRSRTAGETSSHGSHSNSSSSNISPLRNNNGISNIDNIKMQSPHLLRKLVNFTKRNSNSNKNSKSDRKNSRDRATVNNNNDGNSGNRRSVTSRSLNKVFSGVSTIRSITSNKLKLGEKNEKKDDGNGSLSPQFVAINLSALFDRNSGPTPQSSMTPLIVEASAPMTDYTTQDSQDNDNQDIQDIQNTQQMQDNQDNQDNLTIQDITDRMRDSSGNGNGNSSSNSNLISDNNDSNGNGRKESNISISHRDTIDDDFSSEGYHSTPFQTPMAASLSAGIGHNNHDGMTSVNNHNNNNVNGGSSRVNNILNMNETNKSTSTAFDFFDNMNVNLDESLSHINVNMDEIDNINIDGINSLSNINIDRIEHFSSIDNIDDDDLDQLEQQIELEKQKRNALRQHSRSRSSRRGSKGNKEHGSNDDIINESKGGQGGILRQLSRAGSETSNGFSEIEINQSIARHNIDSILRLNSELTDINDGKTDGDIGTIINRNNSGHSGHSGHGRAISYGKEFENDFNDMLILESGISDANLKFALNGQMVNMSNMNGDNNNNENAIINDDSELINNMKRVKNGSLSVSQFGSGLQSYSQSRSETIANGALNTGASIQGLGSNGLNMFESDQMNALALECGDVDLSLLRNENLSTFLEGHR